MKWKEKENALLVLNISRKKVLSYLRCPTGTGHQYESKISSLDIFSNNIFDSLITSFLVGKRYSECIYISIALLLIYAQWS